jgi:xanthine dehydrogenase accessory factor
MEGQNRTDPWSVPEATLYRQLRDRLRSDAAAVVATIVDVEGSAYRRPGAKMVVTPDDRGLGAVTAGCLEGSVIELAREVLADSGPRIETFDLMEDDGEWGLGLGCNGIIDLLLEPLDRSLTPALTAMVDREAATVLTAVDATDGPVPIGARCVLDAAGERIVVDDRDPLPDAAVAEALTATADARSAGRSMSVDVAANGGTFTIFVDTLMPAPRLLLFGSQNDVEPVARFGREAGFDVVVASPRGTTTADDFPSADAVTTTHPTALPELTDERTYVALMSHNLLDDRLALSTLLTRSAVPYVGLMGPRERFERLRDDLAADGTTLTDEQLDRVSTPIGLDLGGGEPAQIALGIVAEALAVHNDRSGGRLADRAGPIHERASASHPPSLE